MQGICYAVIERHVGQAVTSNIHMRGLLDQTVDTITKYDVLINMSVC